MGRRAELIGLCLYGSRLRRFRLHMTWRSPRVDLVSNLPSPSRRRCFAVTALRWRCSRIYEFRRVSVPLI